MQVLAVAALALLAAISVNTASADKSGDWTQNGAQVKASTDGAERGKEGRALANGLDGQPAGDRGPDPWQPGTNPHGVHCDATDWCPGSTSPGAATPAPPPAPAAPGTPGLSDVARFLAGNPTATTEPGTWTLAGAETNFLAGTAESEQTGHLLGRPVTVHFTPVTYAWHYGDGAQQTLSTPGASWQASGLPDFAKTATSHAYAARGTYTVTVTVAFAARYQFAGQAWADIPGTLGLTSDPISVTVKGVKTVLVGKTCLENPTGPGC